MFLVMKAADRRVLQKVAALIVIAVVTLAGLSFGQSVSAHTDFAGSTPSNGEVVTDPITLVTLVFTGESEEAGEGFVILDASGPGTRSHRCVEPRQQSLHTHLRSTACWR
jgi:copper transport protein